MFVDTHAHLFWESFSPDLDKVVTEFQKAGVEKVVVPGVDVETSKKAVELARKYPGVIYAAVGIHPEEVLRIKDISDAAGMIDELAKQEEVVAIGEVGTDLNTKEMREKLPEQKALFSKMGSLSNKHGKPLLIHTRQSLSEAVQVLDGMEEMPRGVFHCFSGTEEELAQVLRRNFYVSFCGNISWSKRVAGLVSQVPENRLLFETDSPFMMPRDREGNPVKESLRNTPVNVKILAKSQASLRREDYLDFSKQVRKNTKELLAI